MQTVLFIDGRNFLGKLKQVFKAAHRPMPSWATFDFRGLVDHVLKGVAVDERRIYFARLVFHPQTADKSRALIEERRHLKRHLESTGFTYIVSGHVRANVVKDAYGHEALAFKEKGVDTKIVTDLVVAACDRKVKTAIIASSDSDLQPAVKELKLRRIEQIYLGFEIEPNKGLTYTTDRTILIRNAEVLQFMGTSTLPFESKEAA
ncbi:MAG: hypothetical protein A2806_02360 [Candidatus Terrybacteria bacterium RIFCSPHIGHO2_01_FULL_48_17]|uniref:NYN domain-containing protein n=1 Tax=Candidatus Terrybacteria bacterium RIFCSPHIGHO2_01_FULL_48_17 TaxID=1802362 RepID=A0A1G2PJN9_9BACT|nr:MAG: hypothetical protein A2806_02360 [Candidatus Terrybacteria bacterium RIFCSPHIGHO2_01_FULL_48_17]OHA53585.1 MAG: hypothetical protein A3A30_00315 [Candidatus Terrybacteria bacterium RIFCSPLOWO2_01_FULL_48_14]